MTWSRREVEYQEHEISDLVVYQMGSISIRPLLTYVAVVLYLTPHPRGITFLRFFFFLVCFSKVFFFCFFFLLTGAKLFCPEHISQVDLSCSRNDSTFKRPSRRNHLMPCPYRENERQNWQLWAEVTVNVRRTL